VTPNPELGGCLAALATVLLNPYPTLAEPLILEEIPEEILRTEIITTARSPLTGEPLSATEYAALEEQLKTQQGQPEADPTLETLLLLLQLRRLGESLVPSLF